MTKVRITVGGDIQKEAEKKRAAKADRRCVGLDGRTICVSESVVDRMAQMDVVVFPGEPDIRWANDPMPRLGEQVGQQTGVGVVIDEYRFERK